MCLAVNATFARQNTMVAELTGAKEGSKAAYWASDMRTSVNPVVVVSM